MVLGSSKAGREVAVVSQRPGIPICGSVGVGRMDVDVGRGIWNERHKVGERRIWAMRDWEIDV